MKLRPVSAKAADESSSSGASSSDGLHAELAKLLRDNVDNNEVIIDWIDVRQPSHS